MPRASSDGIDDQLAIARAHQTGATLDRSQALLAAGTLFGQIDQRVVADDAEGRHVAFLGQAIAQDEELAQDRARLGTQIAGALDFHKALREKDVRGRLDGFQAANLGFQNHEQVLFHEGGVLFVVEVDQIVRVQACIGDLLVAQGALGPIRTLHRLVQNHPKVFVQNRGQARRF